MKFTQYSEDVRLGGISIVPCLEVKDIDEDIVACKFGAPKTLYGLSREISEATFPWIRNPYTAFEACLADFSIHPYLPELEQKRFALPNGFVHANHTHLLSFHVSLPEAKVLKRTIAAAQAFGKVSAGIGVMTLGTDAESGWHLIKDPDSSLGDEMVSIPYRRAIGLHSSRNYFEGYSFLIIKPLLGHT